MSIYKFQDSEPVVTSTTTSVLAASDPLLVYSGSQGRTAQTTVGIASSKSYATAATSATTGTNISTYGFTSLGSSSGPNTTWLLDVPLAAGISKTIVSISTSTANVVTSASTSFANFLSTDSWLGSSITFSKPGAYVELVSISTSQGWLVAGRSAAGVLST